MSARLTRRRFLGASTAVTVMAALAAAGCGDGKRKTAPRATPTPPPAREPVGARGGVLRVYNFNAQVPDSFDPHLTGGGPILNMHSAVFSKLLRYDDERAGSIVPDLAEAMPEQPDELTYIFKLRDGVTFHDAPKFRTAYGAAAGRALDASDVKYSFERQLNRNSPQASRFYRQAAWTLIDTIDVVDQRTVRFTLKQPLAPFAAMLASRHAFVIPREIVDRGTDEAAGELAMLGSGPFMLESFEPGVVVRLRRNPNWFARDDAGGNATGRPYIEGYDAYFSPQEDTFQRAAFDRRLVDATGFIDPAALDMARKTNLSDITLDETDAGALLTSRFLLDRPPFRDDRVRRAIHLAADRRGLADVLYPQMDGHASARLSGPIAPAASRWAMPEDELLSHPGYREERTADTAEARQLWAAALGDGVIGELSVLFSGIPRTLAERGAGALQRQLQETLGLRISPQIDASGGAVIQAALRRNVEGATEGIVGWTFGLEDGGVDLDDWLYAQFHSGQTANTYRLQDATLDAQLEKQRTTFDEDERHEQGLAIQDYLLAKVNARLEFAAPVERRLAWGYVRNYPMPMWHGSTYQLADTWLDSSHPAWAQRPATI